MTSLSNPTTNSQASSNTPSTHSASQSTSGQSSTIAAGTAGSRPTPVSYAQATKKSSFTPPIVSSTVASSPVVGGAPGSNARTSNASPVNGKNISPAVPTVTPAMSGSSVIVNGTSGPPNGHGRKPSIVSGGNGGNAWMQNGNPHANRPQFGSFPANQSAPPVPGSAPVSSPNLSAPAVPNPRVASPQMSPSPLPQPAVSGGPGGGPLSQGMQNQNITFGSLGNVADRGDQRQMHPPRQIVPIPPVAPTSQGAGHRRESSHQQHPEIPQPGMGSNRSGMPGNNNRRNQGPPFGGQNTYQPQGYNHNYNNRNAPNQPRGGGYPASINTPHYQNMPGGNYQSPQRQPPRSPAMHHNVPHTQQVPQHSLPGTPQLGTVQMTNSPSFSSANLYSVPQHNPMYGPAQPSYDPNMYNPHAYPNMFGQPFPTGPPPASPRNQYAQMGGPNPYMNMGMGYVAPPPMQRSSSAAAADINRPPSGFAMPSHAPMASPVPPTPNPAIFKRAEKPKRVILTAPDGTPLDLNKLPETPKSKPVVVHSSSHSSSPVIVSSAPPRQTTDQKKSPEVIRREAAEQVHKKIKEEQEARELEEKKKEEERLKKEAEEAEEKRRKEEEDRKREEEEKERLKKEAEEAARLAEEERKRKEEEARKEAEEKARLEEEERERERIRKEEEAAAEAARIKAAEEAKAEEERRLKEEEERRLKEEEEKRLKEEEERRIKEEEERQRRLKEEQEAAERKAKEEEERLAKEEADKKQKQEQEAKAAEAAAAAAAKSTEAAAEAPSDKLAEQISSSHNIQPTQPTDETARPLKPKGKPSPLVLKTSTEPGPPSAALTALRSARFIGDINSVKYPDNILSPNPALNSAAPAGKFKYQKEFLLQFQSVFTEKPSVDWDQIIKDTVGEPTDSARPSTASRMSTSGLGGRSGSRPGSTSAQPPMGSMGNFGSGKFGMLPPPNMLSSAQRFEQSNRASGAMSSNPLPGLAAVGQFRAGPPSISRTNSSQGISQQGGALPQSPRVRSQRGERGSSKRGNPTAGGVAMEKTESKQAEPKPVLTIPASEVKPLVVSENRWKPRTVQSAASTGAQPGSLSAAAPPVPTEDNLLSPEMVQRKVKAALNKMTPEKFDKISGQILDIANQSKFETDGRTLRQVIQLTFEKATDEAAWSSMYAKFCKVMMENMDPNIKDEGIKDHRTGKVVTGGILFRKYLLNRCQEEFQRGWKVNLPPKPEGETDEAAMLSDEYYIAAAAKRRGLGLIQFIGELFKLGMLTERIMHECVKKLVDYEGVPEEAEVESLCKLLRTIGAALDSTEKSRPSMDAYFDRIQTMINHPEIQSRLKFMLMDIVDLRKKNWELNEVDKGPKTLAEIQADVAKAAAEKEAASRANAQRGGRPAGGRNDSRTFSQGGYGPSEFQRQMSNTLNTEDLRKLKQRNDRNLNAAGGQASLGPPSMFAGRGSNPKRMGPPSFNRGDDSGPASRTATPPAGTTTSRNSFHVLGDMGSQANDGDANDSISPAPSAASSPPLAKATPVMRSLTGKE